MTDLAPVLQGFFTDRLARQKKASPNTVAAYRDTCRLLLAFARDQTGKQPAQLSLSDLDAALIGGFLNHLEEQRGNGTTTRNARLAAIHSLFRYAAPKAPEHAAIISQVLAIPPRRRERAIVSYLTAEAIKANSPTRPTAGAPAWRHPCQESHRDRPYVRQHHNRQEAVRPCRVVARVRDRPRGRVDLELRVGQQRRQVDVSEQRFPRTRAREDLDRHGRCAPQPAAHAPGLDRQDDLQPGEGRAGERRRHGQHRAGGAQARHTPGGRGRRPIRVQHRLGEYRQLRDTALNQWFVQHETKASLATTILALDTNKAARAELTDALAVAQADAVRIGDEINSTYSSNRTLTIVLLTIAIVFGAGIAYLITRSLTSGARQMLDAAQGIAEGDVDQDIDVRSTDEIGQTARAFQDMIAYLKNFAGVAQRMADGDLTVDVQPKSDRDLLGNSFRRLVTELNGIVGKVSTSAGMVGSSSQQMSSTSEEAGRATGEIASAVGEVATGRRASGADGRVGPPVGRGGGARGRDERRERPSRPPRSPARRARSAEEGVDAAEQANEAMHSVRDSIAGGDRGDPRAGGEVGADRRDRRRRSPGSPSRPTCWR